MKKIFLFTCAAVLFSININAQTNIPGEREQIENTLNEFINGYKERDTSKVLTWFEKLFYDDIEIIGTFSIEPGTREWDKGKEYAIRLFKSDWIGWGDLVINLETANISSSQNLAWVSLPAIISRSPENSKSRTAEESFSNMLKHLSEIEADPKIDRNLKLHKIAYYSNLLLFQYEQGEEFVWPVRISATLQKENDVWKFRQIHFSYPNRGFPNVRY